jgi:hypothetical protein
MSWPVPARPRRAPPPLRVVDASGRPCWVQLAAPGSRTPVTEVWEVVQSTKGPFVHTLWSGPAPTEPPPQVQSLIAAALHAESVRSGTE